MPSHCVGFVCDFAVFLCEDVAHISLNVDEIWVVSKAVARGARPLKRPAAIKEANVITLGCLRES